MKKLFLLIFLLLIIVAGVFFLKNDRSDEENVSTISGPPAHQIYDAIRELTTAQFTDYGMAIALLVPGFYFQKHLGFQGQRQKR